jgi:hypothetical protein
VSQALLVESAGKTWQGSKKWNKIGPVYCIKYKVYKFVVQNRQQCPGLSSKINEEI